MTVVINDLQKFTFTVTEQDAAGRNVPISGIPAWTSSDDAVATVLAAPDGLSAVVVSNGIGSAQITASVDGLTVTDFVVVQASPGVSLTLTASAPEPK